MKKLFGKKSSSGAGSGFKSSPEPIRQHVPTEDLAPPPPLYARFARANSVDSLSTSKDSSFDFSGSSSSNRYGNANSEYRDSRASATKPKGHESMTRFGGNSNLPPAPPPRSRGESSSSQSSRPPVQKSRSAQPRLENRSNSSEQKRNISSPSPLGLTQPRGGQSHSQRYDFPSTEPDSPPRNVRAPPIRPPDKPPKSILVTSRNKTQNESNLAPAPSVEPSRSSIVAPIYADTLPLWGNDSAFPQTARKVSSTSVDKDLPPPPSKESTPPPEVSLKVKVYRNGSVADVSPQILPQATPPGVTNPTPTATPPTRRTPSAAMLVHPSQRLRSPSASAGTPGSKLLPSNTRTIRDPSPTKPVIEPTRTPDPPQPSKEPETPKTLLIIPPPAPSSIASTTNSTISPSASTNITTAPPSPGTEKSFSKPTASDLDTHTSSPPPSSHIPVVSAALKAARRRSLVEIGTYDIHAARRERERMLNASPNRPSTDDASSFSETVKERDMARSRSPYEAKDDFEFELAETPRPMPTVELTSNLKIKPDHLSSKPNGSSRSTQIPEPVAIQAIQSAELTVKTDLPVDPPPVPSRSRKRVSRFAHSPSSIGEGTNYLKPVTNGSPAPLKQDSSTSPVEGHAGPSEHAESPLPIPSRFNRAQEDQPIASSSRAIIDQGPSQQYRSRDISPGPVASSSKLAPGYVNGSIPPENRSHRSTPSPTKQDQRSVYQEEVALPVASSSMPLTASPVQVPNLMQAEDHHVEQTSPDHAEHDDATSRHSSILSTSSETERPPPGPYPLIEHITHPELLTCLLQYISFRGALPLFSLTAATRKQLEVTRELKEAFLERYLSATVGYVRWSVQRMGDAPEPPALSLRDLNSYMRGISVPPLHYGGIANNFVTALAAAKNPGRPPVPKQLTNQVRMMASSCRAYTKVVLRLRAQAEAESRFNPPTPPLTNSRLGNRLSKISTSGGSTHPPTSTPSSAYPKRSASPAFSFSSNHHQPHSYQRPSSHSRSNSSDEQLSIQGVAPVSRSGRFRSPLWKAGHAPLLRVFVPSPEGAWLSDSTVIECERELKRAGVLGLIRAGDVVWDLAAGEDANTGRLVWDGNYLIDLDYDYSATGELPRYIDSLAFSPAYWHKIIKTTGNPICQIDLTPFAFDIANSVGLVQDRVRTEGSKGGHHTVVRWVYQARIRIRPGALLNPYGGQSTLKQSVQSKTVDPAWEGVVVIEAEGTNEGLADLQARCGPSVTLMATKKVGKAPGDVIEDLTRATYGHQKPVGKTAFRLLRNQSRPGEIWLRCVREKERIL